MYAVSSNCLHAAGALKRDILLELSPGLFKDPKVIEPVLHVALAEHPELRYTARLAQNIVLVTLVFDGGVGVLDYHHIPDLPEHTVFGSVEVVVRLVYETVDVHDREVGASSLVASLLLGVYRLVTTKVGAVVRFGPHSRAISNVNMRCSHGTIVTYNKP